MEECTKRGGKVKQTDSCPLGNLEHGKLQELLVRYDVTWANRTEGTQAIQIQQGAQNEEQHHRHDNHDDAFQELNAKVDGLVSLINKKQVLALKHCMLSSPPLA